MLISSFAFGDATEAFARRTQPVRMRRYASMDEGVRPRGLRRSRSGRYRVFSWPDGTIEHIDEWVEGQLYRRTTFDVSGQRMNTIFFEARRPKTVRVHGRSSVDVDVSEWSEWSSGVVTLLLPKTPSDDQALTVTKGTVRWRIGPEMDVFSDETRERLRRSCACKLEDRSTVRVRGQAGARYRISLATPDQDRWGETWMIPLPNKQTLYFAAVTEAVTSEPTDIAIARAALALVSFRKSP